MDKLILENFRTYKNRTEIDFAPITILTGKNNSGKSTILKAILLLSDYLNSDNQLDLKFDGPSGHKHKIDCMKNALTWGSESESFEIAFEKDGFRFSFEFGNYGMGGLFHRLVFTHIKTSSKMAIESLADSVLDFEIDDFFLESFNQPKNGNADSELKNLTDSILKFDFEIERIDEDLKLFKVGSSDSIELINRKNLLQRRMRDIQKRINQLTKITKKQLSGDKNVYNSYLYLKDENDISLTIVSLLRRFLSRYFSSDEFKEEFGYSDQRELKNIAFVLPEKLNSALNYKAHHLGPNRTHQARLYLNQNRSTEINEIMADYAHRTPPPSSPAKEFLIKWMKVFEIGIDVNVESIEATASYIKITEEGKTDPINLTDKGFGAGQVLTILMKICNEIQRQKDARAILRQFQFSHPIIMIEEPETNLHPMLQSRLADMFYDAFNQFGIHFILETHSEYFIRRFKLLVAKGEIDRTNILIYYIFGTGEEQLRKLEILDNGKLSGSFGEGFFDHSDSMELELYSINLKNRD